MYQMSLAVLTAQDEGPSIAKPELMYPESKVFKSTRPSGSGDLAQNSTGHNYSGSALKKCLRTWISQGQPSEYSVVRVPRLSLSSRRGITDSLVTS
jgi:hypothetical protein